MNALMHGPLAALGKVCVATREDAFKRLFSCVGPNVVLQGVLARKDYSTMFAYKRFLARVCAHMIGQAELVIKTFATSWVVTYVIPFSNCLSYRTWRGCSHLLKCFMAAPVRR